MYNSMPIPTGSASPPGMPQLVAMPSAPGMPPVVGYIIPYQQDLFQQLTDRADRADGGGGGSTGGWGGSRRASSRETHTEGDLTDEVCTTQLTHTV